MNQTETNKKNQWIVVLVIAVLAIAAVVAWKFWTKPADTPAPSPVGEKKVSIKAAGDPLEALAGQKGQKAAGLVVKEESAGSLASGQTILLTLPDNARWESVSLPKAANGLSLELGKIDGGTAELKAVGTSTSPAELVISNTRINLEAGKTGPVAVKVSGSAGLSGEFTLAQAVAPISAAVADKSILVIGKRGQKLPDLTVTETRAGSLIKSGAIRIDLPEGVFLEGNPKAEVASGDLKVDRVYQTEERSVFIEIAKESTEVSSIKLKNLNVYLNRVVPEGDAVLILGGDAVNQTGGAPDQPWPNTSQVASVTAAEVFAKTPIKTRFTVGSTRYTLNGVESTMDSAAYLANGNVYVSSKYAARALGASETSVSTDAAAGMVTLVKEGKTVQLKVGSGSMLVNNVNAPLAAAPEIKDGRIMLPIGPLAQVYGGTATMDSVANSVTVLVK